MPPVVLGSPHLPQMPSTQVRHPLEEERIEISAAVSDAERQLQAVAPPAPPAPRVPILRDPRPAAERWMSAVFRALVCTELPTPADGPLLVDPTGPRTAYQRISDAVAAAAPGQVIFVAPGRYEEVVLVDKDVFLVGSRAVVVECGHDNPVHCAGPAAPLVRGITIRGRSASAPAVYITDGSRARIEDCDVTSAGLACVEVRGAGCDASVRHCAIHDGAQVGVLVHEGAGALVEAPAPPALLPAHPEAAPAADAAPRGVAQRCGVYVHDRAGGAVARNRLFRLGPRAPVGGPSSPRARPHDAELPPFSGRAPPNGRPLLCRPQAAGGRAAALA
eukprot:tig00020685_g12923.t1